MAVNPPLSSSSSASLPPEPSQRVSRRRRERPASAVSAAKRGRIEGASQPILASITPPPPQTSTPRRLLVPRRSQSQNEQQRRRDLLTQQQTTQVAQHQLKPSRRRGRATGETPSEVHAPQQPTLPPEEREVRRLLQQLQGREDGYRNIMSQCITQNRSPSAPETPTLREYYQMIQEFITARTNVSEARYQELVEQFITTNSNAATARTFYGHLDHSMSLIRAIQNNDPTSYCETLLKCDEVTFSGVYQGYVASSGLENRFSKLHRLYYIKQAITASDNTRLENELKTCILNTPQADMTVVFQALERDNSIPNELKNIILKYKNIAALGAAIKNYNNNPSPFFDILRNIPPTEVIGFIRNVSIVCSSDLSYDQGFRLTMIRNALARITEAAPDYVRVYDFFANTNIPVSTALALFSSWADHTPTTDLERNCLQWKEKLRTLSFSLDSWGQLDIPAILSAPNMAEDSDTLSMIPSIVGTDPQLSPEKKVAICIRLCIQTPNPLGNTLQDCKQIIKRIIFKFGDVSITTTILNAIPETMDASSRNEIRDICLQALLASIRGSNDFRGYCAFAQAHPTELSRYFRNPADPLHTKYEKFVAMQQAINTNTPATLEHFLEAHYLDTLIKDEDLRAAYTTINEFRAILNERGLIPANMLLILENHEKRLLTKTAIQDLGAGSPAGFIALCEQETPQQIRRRIDELSQRITNLPSNTTGRTTTLRNCGLANRWVQNIETLTSAFSSNSLGALINTPIMHPECLRLALAAAAPRPFSLEQQLACALLKLQWLERQSSRDGNGILQLMRELETLEGQMGSVRYQSMKDAAQIGVRAFMDEITTRLQHIRQISELKTLEREFNEICQSGAITLLEWSNNLQQTNTRLLALNTPILRRMVTEFQGTTIGVELHAVHRWLEALSLLNQLQDLETSYASKPSHTAKEIAEYHRKRGQRMTALSTLIPPLSPRRQGLYALYALQRPNSSNFTESLEREVNYHVHLRKYQSISNPERVASLEALQEALPDQAVLSSLFTENRALWAVHAQGRIEYLAGKPLTATTLAEILNLMCPMTDDERVRITLSSDVRHKLEKFLLLERLHRLEQQYPPNQRSSNPAKKEEYYAQRARLMNTMLFEASIYTEMSTYFPDRANFHTNMRTQYEILDYMFRVKDLPGRDRDVPLAHIRTLRTNHEVLYNELVETITRSKNATLNMRQAVVNFLAYDLLQLTPTQGTQARTQIIWNFAKYAARLDDTELLALLGRWRVSSPQIHNCFGRSETLCAIRLAQIYHARNDEPSRRAEALFRFTQGAGFNNIQYETLSAALAQLDPTLQQTIAEATAMRAYLKNIELLRSATTASERATHLAAISQHRAAIPTAVWDAMMRAEPTPAAITRLYPYMIAAECERTVQALQSASSPAARAQHILRFAEITELTKDAFQENTEPLLEEMQSRFESVFTASTIRDIAFARNLMRIEKNQAARIALASDPRNRGEYDENLRQAVLNEDRALIEEHTRKIDTLRLLARDMGEAAYTSMIQHFRSESTPSLQSVIDAADIDVRYRIPTNYYEDYRTDYPEIPPPTCPEGMNRSDLREISNLLSTALETDPEFRNSENLHTLLGSEYNTSESLISLHYEFYSIIQTFLRNIENRVPIEALQHSLSREEIYTGMENALLQILRTIQQTQDPDAKKKLIREFFKQLLIATKHCGIAQVNATRTMYEDFCHGGPTGDDAQVKRQLAANRRWIVESDIPPPSHENIVFTREFHRNLGVEFAVPGTAAVLEGDQQGIVQYRGAGGKFIAERERMRLAHRIRPAAIFEQTHDFVNDSDSLRAFCVAQCIPPSAWTNQTITDAEALVQRMRSQEPPASEDTIKSRLRRDPHYFIIRPDQAIETVIEETRIAEYRASLITTTEPPKVKRQAIEQALVNMHVLEDSGVFA